MCTVFKAMIPLNPKTKKNSQEIRFRISGKSGFWEKTKLGMRYVGIPFISQNKAYEQYEKDAGWFLNPKPYKPIDYPVTVQCIFYRKDRVRCDLTNLLEAIDDILVKYKILADDNFNIIISHDGSRVCIDKENPRTEICIYESSKVLLP